MTTNIKDEALKLALEAFEKMGRVMKQSPDTEKAIVAIRKALAEHIEQHLEMVEQSTCKQALQVEQPAQIPDALERLMRESDKPTQVPEQLAKYVAAIVQGTHEITSVTIRPKRASKPWDGLTDRENAVIQFALHRFMTDAYAQMTAAAQDKDNRYFKPGAVDAFANDAKDAESLLAKLREKNT